MSVTEMQARTALYDVLCEGVTPVHKVVPVHDYPGPQVVLDVDTQANATEWLLPVRLIVPMMAGAEDAQNKAVELSQALDDLLADANYVTTYTRSYIEALNAIVTTFTVTSYRDFNY